jgi:alpha-glucosidase
MDGALEGLEFVFICSSTSYICVQSFAITPYLGVLYLLFLLSYASGLLKLAPTRTTMVFASPLALFNAFFYFTLFMSSYANCKAVPVARVAGTMTTSFRPIFTVPSEADNGANLLPNINDPQAVNAQDKCPGYKASHMKRTSLGLTARLTLAGPACNVYGTDVDVLDLSVEYQSADRLNVNIQPHYLSSKNESWFILPEYLVPKPHKDDDAEQTVLMNDFAFFWSNEPTFSFTIIRRSTGDVAFSTMGSKLVYENQFIEFVTAMPENYNLYGLGEVLHGLRLGNNFTRTIYAADVGDPLDQNLYGSHPVYMDTRYYETDQKTGNMNLVTDAHVSTKAEYTSMSHMVYLRNAHGQEVLLRPSNITWRTLGGAIDLTFYTGGTPAEAISQYQKAGSGLPKMENYWSFGFHQCRYF